MRAVPSAGMGHESEESGGKPAAPRRRPRTAWLGAGAVLVALAVGAGITYAAMRPAVRPIQAAVASQSREPSPSTLDERGACGVLAPAVQDGITAMKNISKRTDGTSVDRAALAASITALSRVYDNGPADLTQPVGQLRERLLALQGALNGQGNVTIDTFGFSLIAQGILDQCRRYA
jgi:hypothetical protein